MPVSSTTWTPGKVGNPGGRPRSINGLLTLPLPAPPKRLAYGEPEAMPNRSRSLLIIKPIVARDDLLCCIQGAAVALDLMVRSLIVVIDAAPLKLLNGVRHGPLTTKL